MKTFFSGSWKTSSTGITLIVMAGVHLYFKRHELTEEDFGIALAAILAGIGNLVARDDDKTSEQVGAGQKGKE